MKNVVGSTIAMLLLVQENFRQIFLKASDFENVPTKHSIIKFSPLPRHT